MPSSIGSFHAWALLKVKIAANTKTTVNHSNINKGLRITTPSILALNAKDLPGKKDSNATIERCQPKRDFEAKKVMLTRDRILQFFYKCFTHLTTHLSIRVSMLSPFGDRGWGSLSTGLRPGLIAERQFT